MASGPLRALGPDSSALRVRSRAKNALGVAAIVVAILGLLPPISTEARRYVFVGALQFAMFALVVPAFVVLAAPFSTGPLSARAADLAARRRRHTGFPRALAVLVLSQAVLVLWRTPVAVNGLVHHIWLAPVELVTLASVGAALWLELVESPPLAPRSPRQRRIVLAACAMWTTWVVAYLVGLSHNTWYTAYASARGRIVSVAADQQIMAGLLWAMAAFMFWPVIFANLMAWLRDDQNPDEELARLTREERRRQRWNPSEAQGGGSS